ncbi:MAG: DUF1800 domain-containing protein, partial [Armatimonadetes bacterium]|nr:DUF1800 domain-containing protein [Armatimonadota bacterium]
MYDHIETLRENATGKFLDLLTAVSTDQAMLYWLDNNENVSGSPNENFAREVMELFTLGVDNGYTEKDVQEAARAFTGWTFGVGRGGRFRQTRKPNRNTRFFNVARNHDNGRKTILNRTGNHDGHDVLRILCNEPRTADYIVTKMWEWFAYESPDEELVFRLATKWRKNGLDIKVLVRAIMESEEFYSEKSYRRLVKNPIDFCLAPLRALGVGRPIIERMQAAEGQGKRRAAGVSRLLMQRTRSMGMALLFPPDVDGWVSGTQWISTSTMVERIKYADLIFGQRSRAAVASIARGLGPQVAQTDAVVERLLSIFDAELPPEKIQLLKESAEQAAGGTISRQNLQPVLLATTRLIFGSPEFQFS